MSQNLKKSFNYRSSSTWNRLLKDWALNDLSYDMFKENILKWLASKRNDQFVYYYIYFIYLYTYHSVESINVYHYIVSLMEPQFYN